VVTRLIAELEAELGTRLFQRTTRRVSLTDAGEAYLGRVRQILQDIDEADAIASAHTHELMGRLRVHTQPALASYVIAPLLSGFRQRHPGIVIDVDVEAHREPPIEDYDITLLGVDASFDADIVARKILESNVVLVASPDYVARKGNPTSPEDLRAHECLRLRKAGGSAGAWRLWRELNPGHVIEVNVDPVLIANHTDTLLRAALDGAGITPISLDIIAPYLARREMIRVLKPWVTGRLAMYAALPSRKFVPQRSRVFLDYLVEQTRAQSDQAARV
ncbi:MAG TPA: LysR substrate-binding domain-containing protein, partial [Castellaniella sp.]|nr:LysR substrate-binding domain-containing protein [Castellaniella sp.]